MSTNLQVLTSAIEHRKAATIRLGGRRADDRLQIRLLVAEKRLGEEGIWVELVRGDVKGIDRLIAAQTLLEVSFISGPMRVFFETTILSRRRPFMRGERLMLAWPLRLRVSERRGGDRERVPREIDVAAHLQLADGADPMPLYVWDLSPTGASFLWPPGKRPPKFKPGEHLRISLNFWGADHSIVVRHRHTQTLAGGRVRLGVEFEENAHGEPDVPMPLVRLLEDLKSCRIRSTLGAALSGAAE